MKKHLIFMLLALFCATAVFTSCSKDDDKDEDTKATVSITVKSGGSPQSGITIYMFDSFTTTTVGFDRLLAEKNIVTGSDGTATIEIEDVYFAGVDNQKTFYFVTFTTNTATGKDSQDYAAITLKKGESKSATINIGGTTTYDNGGSTTGGNDNGGTTGGNTSSSKNYVYKKLTFTFDKDDEINIIYGAIDVETQSDVSLNQGSRDIVLWYNKTNGFSLLSPNADFLSNYFSDYVSTSKWTKFVNKGALKINSTNYKTFLDDYANKTITTSDNADATILTNGTYKTGTSYGTTLKLNDAAFFETFDGAKGFIVLEELYSNAEVLSLYVVLP